MTAMEFTFDPAKDVVNIGKHGVSRALANAMFALDVGSAHEVQIVNYLTAMGIKIGLLLNFGGRIPPGVQAHSRYFNPENRDRMNRMDRIKTPYPLPCIL